MSRTLPWHRAREMKRAVYFVQEADGGFIKIGETTNITKRLVRLQTGNPRQLYVLGLIRGGRLREWEIHRRFAGSRVSGEWFRPTEALSIFIRENAGVKSMDDIQEAPSQPYVSPLDKILGVS